MKYGISRRAAIAGVLPLFADQKKAGQALPQSGEFVRFTDSVTENPVVRLTYPVSVNLMSSPANRTVSVKQRILVFSSDRSGSLSPHVADLRTGLIAPIVETDSLDGHSIVLDAAGRAVRFLDGGRLCQAAISKHEKSARTLSEEITSFSCPAETDDIFAIRHGKLLHLHGGEETVLASQASGPCLAKPGGDGCLFIRHRGAEIVEYWLASSGLTQPLKITEGNISGASWSGDGASLFFLREVHGGNPPLIELHQVEIASGAERCISTSGQFASFAPNHNDTVFVGASRSRAQPNIVLTLRSPHRELTLCEHHSHDVDIVRPIFSPNSQRVYFGSDREGKPAIYSVNVESLIEST